MPSHSRTDEKQQNKAPKRAADELDSGALDRVTGGMASTIGGVKTGLKVGKTGDPCEGGE